VINLKTAKALGLTIRQTLLQPGRPGDPVARARSCGAVLVRGVAFG